VLPVWRLHRHVGMGGDKFVAAVAGEEVEERLGDELRDPWEELFDEWSRCRSIEEPARTTVKHELERRARSPSTTRSRRCGSG
jgi:hypothetical protein